MSVGRKIKDQTPLLVLCLAVAASIAFGLWGRHFFLSSWNDQVAAQVKSSYLQFWAAILMVLATILLVYVTWIYARDNKTLVSITRETFDRSQRVYVEFGLTNMGTTVGVWVANLGIFSFMVTGIEYLHSHPQGSSTQPVISRVNNVVIEIGKNCDPISLPAFWEQSASEALLFGVDLQIRIRLLSLGAETWSLPRSFHFRVPGTGFVEDLKNGYHAARQLLCPNCRVWPLLMRTDGIQSEDELLTKVQEQLSALANSCPNHQPSSEVSGETNTSV
jgi:hypothetical protein